MKKTIVAIMAALVSQTAFAGELYCGVNVEQVPGSQVYNKSLYWEKADTSKPTTHFLKKDGTLVRMQDLNPEILAKLQTGDVAIGLSFSEDHKPILFLGKVKTHKNGPLTFTNTAASMAFNADGVFLLANNVAFTCKEM